MDDEEKRRLRARRSHPARRQDDSPRIAARPRARHHVWMLPDYTTDEPARVDIDARPGILLLEFGSPYCGHCRRAEPLVEDALAGRGAISHVRVFDGRGRPLGRSFGVKLWPTLIVLQDGVEKERFVRPQDAAPLVTVLDALTRAP